MKLTFKKRTDRAYMWETVYMYRDTDSESIALYNWLYSTFGPTGAAWDHYGNWIFLRGDAELVVFKLRWGLVS